MNGAVDHLQRGHTHRQPGRAPAPPTRGSCGRCRSGRWSASAPAHFHQHPLLRRQGGDAVARLCQRAVRYSSRYFMALLRLGRIGGELRSSPAPARWRRPGQPLPCPPWKWRIRRGPGRTRPGDVGDAGEADVARDAAELDLAHFQALLVADLRTSPGMPRHIIAPSAAVNAMPPPPLSSATPPSLGGTRPWTRTSNRPARGGAWRTR